MKKYLLAALLVLSASTYAVTTDTKNTTSTKNTTNVIIFGGLNLNGKGTGEYSSSFEDSNSSKFKADELGYTVGIEAHTELAKFANSKIEIGIGTKYETNIVPEDSDGETFASTLPVYGSAKLSFPTTNGKSIYLQGTLGYTFAFEGETLEDSSEYYKSLDLGIKTKLNGGLYTGFGIGLDSKKYNLGVTYSVSNFEYEVTDGVDYEKLNVDYSKISLTAGYKFGK